MASRWLVVLLATAVAGCASFKGAPDQSISEDDPNRSIPRIAINTVLKQAVTDIEAKKKFSQEERNEIVFAAMAEIDALYGAFEVGVVGEVRRSGFFTTLAELAVDGAGSFAGGGTSRILSAVSAGITGATESFDKDILVDRTVQALTAQMRASRKLVRARILPRLKQPIRAYPLTAAVSDLIAYRQAGTIVSALQKIAADATDADQKSSASLARAETAAFSFDFGADDASATIRERLNPEGGSRDQAFASFLQLWLIDNEVTIEFIGTDGAARRIPPRLTTFIEAAEFAVERRRFIDFLNSRPDDGN